MLGTARRIPEQCTEGVDNGERWTGSRFRNVHVLNIVDVDQVPLT
jgi:hypothetical protein